VALDAADVAPEVSGADGICTATSGVGDSGELESPSEP
jgi:hypothetical protein